LSTRATKAVSTAALALISAVRTSVLMERSSPYLSVAGSDYTVAGH
jgi:hypothetical protein